MIGQLAGTIIQVHVLQEERRDDWDVQEALQHAVHPARVSHVEQADVANLSDCTMHHLVERQGRRVTRNLAVDCQACKGCVRIQFTQGATRS